MVKFILTFLFDIAATRGEGAVGKLFNKMPTIAAALKGSNFKYKDKVKNATKKGYVLAKEEAKMKVYA